MVIGSRYTDLGFTAALRRALSAIHASCSGVGPNSWKWREAIIAIQFAADAAPYGIVHCMKPPMRGSLPLSMLTLLPTPIPARPPLPWAVPSHTVRKHNTWLAKPAATARHALITD